VGPGRTDHLDRLIGDGGSLLVFAEGTRSRDGRVGRLHSGAALLAAQHDLPVVPIYVSV
jgi:1-acyl-sn-glycerol-3-phosphate acyltransferase